MDVAKKYGIRNAQGILLLVQAILVKLGLLIQGLVLVYLIVASPNVYMMISTISMIVAYLGVFVYCYIGYKKSRVFYFITVGLFLLAIMTNIIMPFRDVPQRIMLALMFGLMSVFMFKQENYKFTNVLIALAALVALSFSIYSAITAKVSSLGEIEHKVFAAIIMYISIFSPVVMVGLFGAAYNARFTKEHHLVDNKQ